MIPKQVPAFSLIEVIISGAIIAATVGALFAVASNTTRLTTLGQDQLIASQLAREGLEAVRQIRDNTFVQTQTCSTTTTGNEAACQDWRRTLLTPEELSRLGQETERGFIKKLETDPTHGFALSSATLSADKPCTEYIDRTTLSARGDAPDSSERAQLFCRRIFIEPVNNLSVEGLSLPEDSLVKPGSALRIRSQVAWLSNGRKAFRSDFAFSGCDKTSDEWCLEQVVVLTDWRAAL